MTKPAPPGWNSPEVERSVCKGCRSPTTFGAVLSEHRRKAGLCAICWDQRERPVIARLRSEHTGRPAPPKRVAELWEAMMAKKAARP